MEDMDELRESQSQLASDAHYRTFRSWLNHHINGDVKVLEEELKDGVVLLQLLESLTGGSLKYTKKVKNPFQAQENCAQVVKKVQQDGVHLENIGGSDIFEGNRKILLGLLWEIILFYSGGAGQSDFNENLLAVLRENCAPYGIKIANLGSDLADGRAYAALVHQRSPEDAADPRQLDVSKGRENITRALEHMKHKLGVPVVVDAEDLASGDNKQTVAFFSVALEAILKHPRVANVANDVAPSDVAEEDGEKALRSYISSLLGDKQAKSCAQLLEPKRLARLIAAVTGKEVPEDADASMLAHFLAQERIISVGDEVDVATGIKEASPEVLWLIAKSREHVDEDLEGKLRTIVPNYDNMAQLVVGAMAALYQTAPDENASESERVASALSMAQSAGMPVVVSAEDIMSGNLGAHGDTLLKGLIFNVLSKAFTLTEKVTVVKTETRHSEAGHNSAECSTCSGKDKEIQELREQLSKEASKQQAGYEAQLKAALQRLEQEAKEHAIELERAVKETELAWGEKVAAAAQLGAGRVAEFKKHAEAAQEKWLTAAKTWQVTVEGAKLKGKLEAALKGALEKEQQLETAAREHGIRGWSQAQAAAAAAAKQAGLYRSQLEEALKGAVAHEEKVDAAIKAHQNSMPRLPEDSDASWESRVQDAAQKAATAGEQLKSFLAGAWKSAGEQEANLEAATKAHAAHLADVIKSSAGGAARSLQENAPTWQATLEAAKLKGKLEAALKGAAQKEKELEEAAREHGGLGWKKVQATASAGARQAGVYRKQLEEALKGAVAQERKLEEAIKSSSTAEATKAAEQLRSSLAGAWKSAGEQEAKLEAATKEHAAHLADVIKSSAGGVQETAFSFRDKIAAALSKEKLEAALRSATLKEKELEETAREHGARGWTQVQAAADAGAKLAAKYRKQLEEALEGVAKQEKAVEEAVRSRSADEASKAVEQLKSFLAGALKSAGEQEAKLEAAVKSHATHLAKRAGEAGSHFARSLQESAATWQVSADAGKLKSTLEASLKNAAQKEKELAEAAREHGARGWSQVQAVADAGAKQAASYREQLEEALKVAKEKEKKMEEAIKVHVSSVARGADGADDSWHVKAQGAAKEAATVASELKAHVAGALKRANEDEKKLEQVVKGHATHLAQRLDGALRGALQMPGELMHAVQRSAPQAQEEVEIVQEVVHSEGPGGGLPPPPPPPVVKVSTKHKFKMVTGSSKEVEVKVVSADDERARRLAEQRAEAAAVQEFKEKYGDLDCAVYALRADSSLRSLEALIGDPSKCAMAFDFDQTLKYKSDIRGESNLLLANLAEAGVPFCIVTAASPTAGSVKALMEETQELGIAHFFGTEKVTAERGEDFMRSWGSNEGLATDQLEEKVALLLTLNSDRYPADLARVGFANMEFAEDLSSVTYRLRRGDTERDWSAEQTLYGKPEDPVVCPVRALKEYCARVAGERAQGEPEEAPEGEEATAIRANDALFVGATPESTELMVERLLRAAQYPDNEVAKVMKDATQELVLPGNVKLARCGNLLASKYNKAEAVELFVSECGPQVEEVFFVDDNSDNVFNVFMHFARREAAGQAGPRVRALWFRPAAHGISENADPLQRRMLHSVVRAPIPRSPLVLAEVGDDLKLRQESGLAPVLVRNSTGASLRVGDVTLSEAPESSLQGVSLESLIGSSVRRGEGQEEADELGVLTRSHEEQPGLPFFVWLPTIAGLSALTLALGGK